MKYLTIAGVIAFFFFAYFIMARTNRKGGTVQNEIEEVLNKEEYKVRGRFE